MVIKMTELLETQKLYLGTAKYTVVDESKDFILVCLAGVEEMKMTLDHVQELHDHGMHVKCIDRYGNVLIKKVKNDE